MVFRWVNYSKTKEIQVINAKEYSHKKILMGVFVELKNSCALSKEKLKNYIVCFLHFYHIRKDILLPKRRALLANGMNGQLKGI